MNVLPRTRQVQVIQGLVEGLSIRALERLTGVHRDTIMRLGLRVGRGCADLQDRMLRDLPCRRLELDEIWSYVGKKQRQVRGDEDHAVGDAWTWVAFDPDTKLVPCFRVGPRSSWSATVFAMDLASRLRGRVQISTDNLAAYVGALDKAFDGKVDYATVVKAYEAEPVGPGRYSPPKVSSITKTPVMGEPVAKLISTSGVERSNLTMRMQIRRYTRLTNAFSKRLENHIAATALHFGYYNFVRTHGSTRVTPAMAAGVTKTVWSVEEMLDAAIGGSM